MTGYHQEYQQHLTDAEENGTMLLSYQEWLEYRVAELEAKIERALTETEKANREYRAMYAEHEGVFVDGYSGIAQILRGASQ